MTPLRGWAGRGKRRRSCDEEESGPRAKKQKQDGESAEVPGPRGARGGWRQPPAPRPGPQLGMCPGPGPATGPAPAPGRPGWRGPASSRAPSGETERVVWGLLALGFVDSLSPPGPSLSPLAPLSAPCPLLLSPPSLPRMMAFTGKSTSTGSTSTSVTRGSSAPWPTAWTRCVGAHRTCRPHSPPRGVDLAGRGCGWGGLNQLQVPHQGRGSPSPRVVSALRRAARSCGRCCG